MVRDTLIGILIPFLGTTLGAGCVFFMKKEMKEKTQKILGGFAAGVMVAASIWSLLIPAIEDSASYGRLAFLPAFIGFWIGILFLLLLDEITPHLHILTKDKEGPENHLSSDILMMLAVTLHNIPEGLAVGVVYAGFLYGDTIGASAALALSIGIAIQNFPEGAIISMPLYGTTKKKGRAFMYGMISGAVEPAAALVAILFAQAMVPVMPYLLSFAAGAMMYVVVEELIPEMAKGEHTNLGVIAFSAGFTIMMMLDVALG
ncbi:MAG: ZIP family metal transporter [Eubacteriales bacterium]